MAMHRFALIVLICFFSGFPGPNAAPLAADDVDAADASERGTVADVSVEVGALNRSVKVGGEPWWIRRAKNPTGSMMLIRNDTRVPLIASFSDEGGRKTVGEPVPAGGAVVRHCEASGASYPLVIASERGERVLNAQLRCGDSVVVQSGDRAVVPVRAINEAWAPPPSESVEEPHDTAEGH